MEKDKHVCDHKLTDKKNIEGRWQNITSKQKNWNGNVTDKNEVRQNTRYRGKRKEMN